MLYANRYLNLTLRSAQGRGYTFGVDWKITFRVRKSASSNYLSFNQTEISIYNMTSDYRTLVAQEGFTVTLDAGYMDKHAVIFDGVVNNITHTKNGLDIITTLYCSSSVRNYDNPVQLSMQNITVTDLLKKICEENGVDYVLPFTRADVVTKSYSGTLARVIAMLCFDYDLSAGIDNGVLIFKDKKRTSDEISSPEIYTFTPLTGVLGSPTINERGVSLKTLMNADIQVNDYFNLYAPYANFNLGNLTQRPNAVTGGRLNAMAHIDTHSYNGLYMALSLEFSGDTRSNTWYTSIEGSRIWSKEQKKRALAS